MGSNHTRQVAIKVFRIDQTQTQTETLQQYLKDAFTREIELLLELTQRTSAAFLPVYETSETLEGAPYYTMPFAYGGSLANREHQLQLASTEDRREVALRLIQTLADGLEELNSLGIVHRDIKPDNVLISSQAGLTRHNADAFVHEEEKFVIADLGLSRKIYENESRKFSNVGTSGYKAPEILTQQTPTITADIFSCTATVLWCLTGLERHADEPHKWKVKVENDFDLALVNVIQQGLHPEKAHRPQNGYTWRRQLNQALDQSATSAPKNKTKSNQTSAEPDPTPTKSTKQADLELNPTRKPVGNTTMGKPLGVVAVLTVSILVVGLGFFIIRSIPGGDITNLTESGSSDDKAASPQANESDATTVDSKDTSSTTTSSNNFSEQPSIHNDSVTFIALETQHQLLISGASDGSVAVRDSTTHQLLAELVPDITTGDTPVPRSAAVSESGQLIAVSHQKGTDIYSTKSWLKVGSLRCGWCLVHWFNDDKTLITISDIETIYWEVGEDNTYRKLGGVASQRGVNHSLEVNADQNSFIILVLEHSSLVPGSSGHFLEQWRVTDGTPEPLGVIARLDFRPWNIALSPDESQIAVVGIGGGNPTKIWTTDGALFKELDTREQSSLEVAWPTEETLVTGGFREIQIWDLTKSEPSQSEFEHGQTDDKGSTSNLVVMAWDDQQKILYSGHEHGQICAWQDSDNSISTTCSRVD